MLLLVSLFLLLKLTFDYSQIFLLYLDNPYLSCKEIMQQSKELMKGNRIRYFYLLISFFGISLLGVVSLGIGFLWITPYMSMTEVEFYRDLINEHCQEFSKKENAEVFSRFRVSNIQACFFYPLISLHFLKKAS